MTSCKKIWVNAGFSSVWWLIWEDLFATLLSWEYGLFQQINQLAVPSVNLESDLPNQNRTRLFSSGELFSVLYGKTRLQQASKEVLSNQGTTQLVEAAGLNTGKPCINLSLSWPKSLFNHARLRGGRVNAWHARHTARNWLGHVRIMRLIATYPNLWQCTLLEFID